MDTLAVVLKNIVRLIVGEPAWFRLTQFKIEFKIRNQRETWDPELGTTLRTVLPKVGYYVDVGAHDGRSSSNTYGLESDGWSGILVEPILSKYFRIRQLRSLETNKIFHAACVPQDYTSGSVQMTYADLMSFSEELSIVNQESWTEGSKQFLNSHEDIVKTYAPARTLNSILDEANAPRHIDFLSIDVEGAEKAVLDGLDLQKYSFSVICVEAQEIASIQELYASKDYDLYAISKNNYVFINVRH